jgi:hypothetical protein
MQVSWKVPPDRLMDDPRDGAMTENSKRMERAERGTMQAPGHEARSALCRRPEWACLKTRRAEQVAPSARGGGRRYDERWVDRTRFSRGSLRARAGLVSLPMGGPGHGNVVPFPVGQLALKGRGMKLSLVALLLTTNYVH